MKKSLYLLIALLLVCAALLAGCQSTDEEQPDPTKTAAAQTTEATVEATEEAGGNTETSEGLAEDANTFPIVDSPTTMTLMALGASAQVEDWETNAVTLYWEEKTGIHIEWDTVYSDAVAQKLGVVMASGDLPDMIMTSSSISFKQVVSYGAQGLIIPMNDLIDKYGTNTQYMFAYDSTVKNQMTAPDGNIYFLPRYLSREYMHVCSMQKCLLNMTWLDNLSLEVPTTTEEFYEVLVAFRDNDANGNGDPDDEIPLATYTGNIAYIMNSFQYYSNSDYLMVEDGTIIPCCTQDGWQDGLEYLRMMYEEGLCDKEIFIADTSQLKLYTGDEDGNRAGAIPTYAYSAVMDITTDIVNEFEFISPLIGPDGVQQTSYIPNSINASFLITEDCENPEAAFRWGDAKLVNALEDTEAFSGIYGPEGEGWALAGEDETGLDGKTPALYKWLFTWGEPNNINYHEFGLLFRGAEYKLLMVANTSGWDQETKLYEATVDLYKPYAAAKDVPTILFEEAVVSEVAELKETISTYVDESVSKFVTGEWDIEADWDAYLEELDNLDLERLLALYQEAYDRQYGE